VVGPEWQVEAVSANLEMVADSKPEAVLGQPLADLIGSEPTHTLRNRVSWIARDDGEVLDFGVRWGEMTADVRAIRRGRRYLIEAEPSLEARLPDGIGMVRSMTDRLSGTDPAAMADRGMRQLQALTGFERVWLCDAGGAVVAGAKAGRSSGEADGPRVIADCSGEPVELVGSDPEDLALSAAFRAPDEQELLAHSADGAAASMTLPLRIDGELVGTLHARHSRPRRCGAERRSVAHLFAERLAARMMRHGWSPSA
jgi:light-regulated signal transduction histidine kinase (bacteriophytochrome)